MLKILFYLLVVLVLTLSLFLEITKFKKGRSLFYFFQSGGLSANDRQTEKDKIYNFLKNMSPPPKEPLREEFDEQENSDEEQEEEEQEKN